MSEKARTLAHIVAFLELIMAPSQVFEIRALKVPQKYGRKAIYAGFFDDIHKAADHAYRRTIEGAEGVYFTPNPVKPELLDRCANRTERVEDKGGLVSDTQILQRRWLLLDFDCIRESGISATEEEHQAALNRAQQARAGLAAEGWGHGIYCDSGNGGHLMYRLDMANDDRATDLVKRVLAGLQVRYGDERVKVDQSVFNAARIWKLPGSQVRKGDSTERRPHRWARCLSLEVPPC